MEGIPQLVLSTFHLSQAVLLGRQWKWAWSQGGGVRQTDSPTPLRSQARVSPDFLACGFRCLEDHPQNPTLRSCGGQRQERGQVKS